MPSMPTTVAQPGVPAQWTYTNPGDSDMDQVRFYLQDTDSTMPLLADLEIQFLIDQWYARYDSLIYVAAVAADRVSAKFAGVVSVSADGVSVNVADLSDRYAALAARLRQAHKDYAIGGEVDITNLMWDQNVDHSIDPLQFGVGIHDNRGAGRQNYGDRRTRTSERENVVGGG